MPRLFWIEILASALAATGAILTYRADLKFLPSILVIVSAYMLTGIFADIEDHLLAKAEAADTPSKINYLLSFVRVVRSSVLLLMGIAAIALLF